MSSIQIIRTDSSNTDFQNLIKKLDIYLAEKDGDDAPFFAALNTVDTIQHVLVAYVNDTAVGCGAIKKYDENTIEIKRMFVDVTARNKGVASGILNELQLWAKELNFTSCILETGKKMTEAINLYKKEGFSIISNYGPYVNVTESTCFQKNIKKNNY
jgi:putative acetyltransferase